MHHNDTISIQTQGQRRKKKGRMKTSFQIYLPLTLLQGFERLACERMLETERKLHILTPLLWPSCCVFLVLLMLGSIPSGLFRGHTRSGVAFPTTSGLWLSGILLATASGVSEVPLDRVWPSLPYLVSNLLGVCWQLLGTQTQLS